MENSHRAIGLSLILISSSLITLGIWVLDFLFSEYPTASGWQSQLFEAVVLCVVPMFFIGWAACKVMILTQRIFNVRVLSVVAGISLFSLLYALFILCALSFLNLLDEVEGIGDSFGVISYAWELLYQVGLPIAVVFLALIWGLPQIQRFFPSKKPRRGTA